MFYRLSTESCALDQTVDQKLSLKFNYFYTKKPTTNYPKLKTMPEGFTDKIFSYPVNSNCVVVDSIVESLFSRHVEPVHNFV